jgi:hypothetical protein
MKLNRKKLNVVLPQIKSRLNVAVMADNPEYPGLIDFIFQPKSRDAEFGYLNRLTCSMGEEDDLFGNDPVGTLGKPLLVNVARLKEALKKSGSESEIQNGVVNGINVLADVSDVEISKMGEFIESCWNSMKKEVMPEYIDFTMSKIDYELMASTVTPFVSCDYARYSMNGYCVDFRKSEDFINFAATDGRRLSLCKFPYKHSKMGDDKDKGGSFIIKPLNLFIPDSDYSRTQWRISERIAVIRIQTKDYSIDCWAIPIEGQFPNYSRVIPTRDENSEWLNLSAKSARNAFNLIKGSIDNSGHLSYKNEVFIDAEDPKRVRLTVQGASADIDGEASRPMRIWVCWDLIAPCFFETPYTKFMLKSANSGILSENSRAVLGTTMAITKITMPLLDPDRDEWGLPNASKVPTPSNSAAVEDKFENEDEVNDVNDEPEDEDGGTIGYGDFTEDEPF